ncbi:hypothetical protein EDB83DRAFT_2494037 [Lactarius deliciosus]|nr:hypothetical protein EDB83DRAFT_2494037 [Lactarius deliciosus]
MKWISLVVDVLYMFSGTLGGVAGVTTPISHGYRDLDVSARGEEKWTPLHAASYYGKLEIVQLRTRRLTMETPSFA